jgi:hypothetical protein
VWVLVGSANLLAAPDYFMATSSFTSDPTADQLRLEMRGIRRELGDNVEEVKEFAEQLWTGDTTSTDILGRPWGSLRCWGIF